MTLREIGTILTDWIYDMESQRNTSLFNNDVFAWGISRCSDSSFWTPTIAKSVIDSTQTNVIVPRPFRNSIADIVDCYISIVSSVAVILFAGRPLAVFRSIIFFVINSIKLMFGSRFFTHILKKQGKVRPAFNVPNPPTSVPMICSIIFIIAPLFHSSPGVVLWPVYCMATMLVVAYVLHSQSIACLFKKENSYGA